MTIDQSHQYMGTPLVKERSAMRTTYKRSCHSSVVEHLIGNEEVDGSIPSDSTVYLPRVVAAFWSKVDVKQARLNLDQCWPWRASLDRHGYGQFKPVLGAPPLRAHRVAWEIFNGRDVPDGRLILHSCDNPRCCNPNHLRPGTHKDNARDMLVRHRNYHRKSNK